MLPPAACLLAGLLLVLAASGTHAHSRLVEKAIHLPTVVKEGAVPIVDPPTRWVWGRP